MIRTPKSRLAVVFLFTLALAGAGAGAASASPDCRTVHGRFSIELSGGPGCASPIGICGAVTWRGSLKATSEFIATDLITTDDTGATGVVLITGDNVLVTTDGEIYTKDAVLFAADGSFTEIDVVVGGTGDFLHATGSWVATGTSTATDAEGSFVGEICWP